MIVRSSHIITLPSGNLARDFRWESLGYGRFRVQYVYTDRRRAHQTARRFTVEFLNGKVETIQARSANGGRVEFFKSSAIINELLEMLSEWALPALINGDYTGIIPLDAPDSTGEAAMVAQFDEDVVQGRSIIVDEAITEK